MSFTFFKYFTNPLSLFLSFLIVFSSCRKAPDEDGTSISNLFDNNHHGVFEFNDYQPLADKPFNIHFYIPLFVDRTNATILFIFPGMNRNA